MTLPPHLHSLLVVTCTCARAESRVSRDPTPAAHGRVEHDVVSIGSIGGSGIELSDSTVSRRHAEVRREKDGVLLADCGSTNGTFVGDVRVREVFLTPETCSKWAKPSSSLPQMTEVIEITPSDKNKLAGMVGNSTAMREVFSIIERVAPTDLTCLITGETGTGKGLASRAVHDLSKRAKAFSRL